MTGNSGVIGVPHLLLEIHQCTVSKQNRFVKNDSVHDFPKEGSPFTSMDGWVIVSCFLVEWVNYLNFCKIFSTSVCPYSTVLSLLLFRTFWKGVIVPFVPPPPCLIFCKKRRMLLGEKNSFLFLKVIGWFYNPSILSFLPHLMSARQIMTTIRESTTKIKSDFCFSGF